MRSLIYLNDFVGLIDLAVFFFSPYFSFFFAISLFFFFVLIPGQTGKCLCIYI